MTARKMVVGITGEIGAGKSTVARRLAERGGCAIDADLVGHETLEEPAIANAIEQAFGPAVRGDVGIDRKSLGRIAFRDRHQLGRLEAIVHPRMEQIFRDRIEALEQDEECRFVVLDAAILFEAGWNSFCDQVIFVGASRPRRLQRLAESRGWTEQQLATREQAQWSADRKSRLCDKVVTNDGSIDDCRRAVDRIVDDWFPVPNQPEQRTNKS